MPKYTKFTKFADLKGLSNSTTDKLLAEGYFSLGDIDEVDFDRIASVANGPAEIKILFEAGIKSGSEFILHPGAPLKSIPTLSTATIALLESAGFHKLEDFDGTYFPEVYKILGYGRGKHLLLALVLAGIKPQFQKPNWTEEEWHQFVVGMTEQKLVSWEDVAAAVCGELNPPQVGTAVASAVKHNYARGKTMREVWKWLYAQTGKCVVSGKRLFLEADHKVPKEQFLKEGRNVKDADTLDNYQLLTKRENVIKRGSHRLGGLSFAPAASVLIYILLRYRPKTRPEFVELCRMHGLTMSEIRMQEAWAFAIWLNRDGQYELGEGALEEAISTGATVTADNEADELL